MLPQIFWSGAVYEERTIAFVNKIYVIATTNYSYHEKSAINVSDQDCVHVAIVVNGLYSSLQYRRLICAS